MDPECLVAEKAYHAHDVILHYMRHSGLTETTKAQAGRLRPDLSVQRRTRGRQLDQEVNHGTDRVVAAEIVV